VRGRPRRRQISHSSWQLCTVATRNWRSGSVAGSLLKRTSMLPRSRLPRRARWQSGSPLQAQSDRDRPRRAVTYAAKREGEQTRRTYESTMRGAEHKAKSARRVGAPALAPVPVHQAGQPLRLQQGPRHVGKRRGRPTRAGPLTRTGHGWQEQLHSASLLPTLRSPAVHATRP